MFPEKSYPTCWVSCIQIGNTTQLLSLHPLNLKRFKISDICKNLEHFNYIFNKWKINLPSLGKHLWLQLGAQFNSSTRSDVIIKLENQSIYAHKVRIWFIFLFSIASLIEIFRSSSDIVRNFSGICCRKVGKNPKKTLSR